MKKLRAFYLLDEQNPNIPMAQRAISDILNNDQPAPVTVQKIVEEVARTFGVTSADIRSSKRSAAVSKARQIAFTPSVKSPRCLSSISVKNLAAGITPPWSMLSSRSKN